MSVPKIPVISLDGISQSAADPAAAASGKTPGAPRPSALPAEILRAEHLAKMQTKGASSMSKKDQQILGKGTLGQQTNEPLRTLKLNTAAASPDNSDSKSKFAVSSSRARSLMALQTKESVPSKEEDAPPVPVLADTERTISKRAAVAQRSGLKERVFQTVLKGFGDPAAKWEFLRKNVAEMFNREKKGNKISVRGFTVIMGKLLLTSVLPVKDLEKCALLDGDDEVSSRSSQQSSLCADVIEQVLVDELLESVFGAGVPSTPSARAAMNAHVAAAADIHGS
jgi:hypothetical protein